MPRKARYIMRRKPYIIVFLRPQARESNPP